jgi:hypothetical protein
MQTDVRSKYVRRAMQTDARNHFWAFEMRRPVEDALIRFDLGLGGVDWSAVILSRRRRIANTHSHVPRVKFA